MASEVIVGAGVTTSLFVGGVSGFTARIITPVDGDIEGDEFVGAPGTYAAKAGIADSAGAWIMQAVAFRVA